MSIKGDLHADVLVRLERRSIRNSQGCWVWQGSVSSGGYGQIRDSSRLNKITHKIAWQLLVGPVPRGYQLHHTCENKRCWNPAHLEIMTPKQHKRLHIGSEYDDHYCPKGHRYTQDNIFVKSDGYITCRICKYAQHKAWRVRRRLTKKGT